MQVAILAGGLATRLRPITETIPKAMVPILGKPFLEYQIEFLKKNGVTDLVLCVGYLSEQIEQYFGDGRTRGVSIRYVRDGKTLLGTAGALKRAESQLNDSFFVMYGDSYVFLDFKELYARFRQSNKRALMVVYRNNNAYDTSNVAVENGSVTWYDKKNSAGDLVFIDYGVLIFDKRVLDLIPQNQVCPLEDIINILIQKKELAAYETKNRFYEIGSHKGMDEFTQYIANQQIL
jgi:N-acetyl-alpha-D-muramate 1-phosphate uridylyltransferase